MVGHAVQGFGSKVVPMLFKLPPFIKIHYTLTDKDSCKYPALKKLQKSIRLFENKLDKMSDWERKRVSQRHERLIALKQMCGNCALAIFIATLILCIKYFSPALLITGLVVATFLYCGHIHSVREERALEKVVLGENQQEQA